MLRMPFFPQCAELFATTSTGRAMAKHVGLLCCDISWGPTAAGGTQVTLVNAVAPAAVFIAWCAQALQGRRLRVNNGASDCLFRYPLRLVGVEALVVEDGMNMATLRLQTFGPSPGGNHGFRTPTSPG